MPYFQKTLAAPITLAGVGVHSGRSAAVTIKPAPPNHGIKFVRRDLRQPPAIPALFKMVTDTSFATVLGVDGVIISTVEHLMACLAGLEIDNAVVDVDGYELPIMDGSARPFTEAMAAAGTVEQEAERCYILIKKPIVFENEDKSVGIYPDTCFRISYTIAYDHPLIGTQTYSLEITETTFSNEISSARTFGFYHEYEQLKQLGLARGGSLENAIVIDDENIVNEDGLRYDNEFVRHKILDCLGDFSLLGLPIRGHIVAYKSGHLFNHKLLEKIFQSKDCWETGLVEESFPPTAAAVQSLAL